MSPTVLFWVRAFLLVGAVVSLLQATVLREWFQRNLTERWHAVGTRLTGQPASTPLPPKLADSRHHRTHGLRIALIYGVAWWFLGTATGSAFFLSLR